GDRAPARHRRDPGRALAAAAARLVRGAPRGAGLGLVRRAPPPAGGCRGGLMIRTLLAWLGRDGGLPEDAALSFEWGHLPRGEAGLLLVVCFALALVLTGWLYRREGSASRLRKLGLASLRVLAFAAL